MSLRIFHIIFVIVSIMLTAFVGVWGIHEYVVTRNTSALTLAIVFIIGGVVMVLYARRVVDKLKEIP